MKRMLNSLKKFFLRIPPWFPALFSIFCIWCIVLFEPTIRMVIIAGAASVILAALANIAILITEAREGKEVGEDISKTENIDSKTESQMDKIEACVSVIKTEVAAIKEQTGYINEILDLLHEFKDMKASQANDVNLASVLASMAHTYEENHQALKAENEEYRKQVQGVTLYADRLEKELEKYQNLDRELDS